MHLFYRYIHTIFLCTLCCLSFQADLFGQNNYGNGVIKVSAGKKVGAGLLVGNLKKKLFVVTSYSLLIESGQQVTKDNIEIKLKEHIVINDQRLIHYSPALNLAVLEVEGSKSPQLTEYTIPQSQQLHAAQSVRIVGHSSESDWDLNIYNRIKRLELDEDSLRMLLSSDRLINGFSGSPVFTDTYEWIGMITEIDNRNTTALKANIILNFLEERNIPNNLILPAFSNLKNHIQITQTQISQKQKIPIDILNQDIFIMDQHIEVVLTKNEKRVKKIAPITLTAGQKNIEFPLKKRVSPSKNYQLRFETDGKPYYSSYLTIGNPLVEKISIATAAIVAGIGIIIITRPLPHPPDPE